MSIGVSLTSFDQLCINEYRGGFSLYQRWLVMQHGAGSLIVSILVLLALTSGVFLGTQAVQNRALNLGAKPQAAGCNYNNPYNCNAHGSCHWEAGQCVSGVNSAGDEPPQRGGSGGGNTGTGGGTESRSNRSPRSNNQTSRECSSNSNPTCSASNIGASCSFVNVSGRCSDNRGTRSRPVYKCCSSTSPRRDTNSTSCELSGGRCVQTAEDLQNCLNAFGQGAHYGRGNPRGCPAGIYAVCCKSDWDQSRSRVPDHSSTGCRVGEAADDCYGPRTPGVPREVRTGESCTLNGDQNAGVCLRESGIIKCCPKREGSGGPPAGGSPNLPDLTVREIQTPQNAKKNDTVTFRITIGNEGNTDAGDFSLYLIINAKTNDPISVRLPNGLAKRSQKEVRIPARLTDNQTNYTVRAVVDPDGRIREKEEGNNDLEASFTVAGTGGTTTNGTTTNTTTGARIEGSPEVTVDASSSPITATIRVRFCPGSDQGTATVSVGSELQPYVSSANSSPLTFSDNACQEGTIRLEMNREYTAMRCRAISGNVNITFRPRDRAANTFTSSFTIPEQNSNICRLGSRVRIEGEALGSGSDGRTYPLRGAAITIPGCTACEARIDTNGHFVITANFSDIPGSGSSKRVRVHANLCTANRERYDADSEELEVIEGSLITGVKITAKVVENSTSCPGRLNLSEVNIAEEGESSATIDKADLQKALEKYKACEGSPTGIGQICYDARTISFILAHFNETIESPPYLGEENETQ